MVVTSWRARSSRAAARSIAAGPSGTAGLYGSTRRGRRCRLSAMDREATFRLVSELVALPAPSGVEDAVDRWLEARLDGRGLHADAAGNRLLRIPGRGAA